MPGTDLGWHLPLSLFLSRADGGAHVCAGHAVAELCGHAQRARALSPRADSMLFFFGFRV
eukprot:2032617-Rhodomonas_salina.1